MNMYRVADFVLETVLFVMQKKGEDIAQLRNSGGVHVWEQGGWNSCLAQNPADIALAAFGADLLGYRMPFYIFIFAEETYCESNKNINSAARHILYLFLLSFPHILCWLVTIHGAKMLRRRRNEDCD